MSKCDFSGGKPKNRMDFPRIFVGLPFGDLLVEVDLGGKQHDPKEWFLVHPWKLTWNLKRRVSQRNLLLEGSIFRFHVSFRRSKHVQSVNFNHSARLSQFDYGIFWILGRSIRNKSTRVLLMGRGVSWQILLHLQTPCILIQTYPPQTNV